MLCLSTLRFVTGALQSRQVPGGAFETIYPRYDHHEIMNYCSLLSSSGTRSGRPSACPDYSDCSRSTEGFRKVMFRVKGGLPSKPGRCTHLSMRRRTSSNPSCRRAGAGRQPTSTLRGSTTELPASRWYRLSPTWTSCWTSNPPEIILTPQGSPGRHGTRSGRSGAPSGRQSSAVHTTRGVHIGSRERSHSSSYSAIENIPAFRKTRQVDASA